MLTPLELKRSAAAEIAQKYNSTKRLTFSLKSFNINESVEKGETHVDFSYTEARPDESHTVNLSSSGKGIVAALFNGLLGQYKDEYGSVGSITFDKINVKTYIEAESQSSEVEFMIDFRNGRKQIATFRARSRSILSAAALCVMKCFQFYINLEISFHKMRAVLEDARKRGRSDIAARIVTDMSKIVEFNSYEPRL